MAELTRYCMSEKLYTVAVVTEYVLLNGLRDRLGAVTRPTTLDGEQVEIGLADACLWLAHIQSSNFWSKFGVCRVSIENRFVTIGIALASLVQLPLISTA